jgi:hypothetical protein
MLEVVHTEQFDLSYYISGMTFQDTENMSVFERKKLYGHLVKRKMEENDKAESQKAELDKNMAARQNRKDVKYAMQEFNQSSTSQTRTDLGRPGGSKGYTI